MHILPHATHSRQRETDENPSICGGFSVKKLPDGMTAKTGWKWTRYPRELQRERSSHRRVWQVLHETCCDTDNCAVWKSDATLASEAETSERSVQDALKRFVATGWIVKESGKEAGDPSKDRVIWCRWARQADGRGCDPAGSTPVGYGMSISFDKPEPIRRGVMKGAAIEPTGAARNCGTSAADLAHLMPDRPQKSADKVNPELIQENVNVNVADAGGEAEKCGPSAEASPAAELVDDQVEAEQLPAVVPPAPSPVASAAEVEAALGRIKQFARRDWLAMIQEADVRIVRDAGRVDQLPAAVLAIDFAARASVPAAPEAAPAVEAPSPPPPTDLKKLETITLIHRLKKRDAADREEIVSIIAGRMAWDWDDFKSINAFKKRLRMIGPRKSHDLNSVAVASAFLSADKFAGADRKGKIFNSLLRPALDRIEQRPAGA